MEEYMKKTIITAIFIAFLIVTLLVVGSLPAHAAQGSTETPEATASVTATPIPPGQAFATQVINLQSNIADPALAIGKLLLTLFVTLVAALAILYLIIHLLSPANGRKLSAFLRKALARLRKRQTVIAEFNNTTGESTDQLIKTVRALMAEELRQSQLLKDAIYGDPNKAPVEEEAKNQLETMLEGIESRVEDIWVKIIVLIVKTLFPAPGTKVTGDLVKIGPAPQSHGLIVELCDLVTNEANSTRTFWGPASDPVIQNISIPAPTAPVASQESPDLAGVYLKIGKRFSDLDQYPEAIGYLEEALKCAPGSQEIAATLASAVAGQIREQKVRSEYTVGVKFQSMQLLHEAKPYYMRALSFEQDSEGEKALDLALNESNPLSKRAWAFHFLGQVCEEKRLRPEAEAFHGKAAESDPASPEYKESLAAILRRATSAYTELGSLFEGLGNYTDAEKYFSAALEKSPGDGEIAAGIARVKSKQPPEEDSKEAQYQLGLIYKSKGLYEKAVTCFETAISKDPTYTEATEALKSILGLEQRTSAHIFRDLTTDAANWVGFQLTQQNLTRLQESLTWRYMKPERKVKTLNYYGYLFTKGKYYPGAIESFEEAIKIREMKKILPDWYFLYQNLGDVYSYAGMQKKSMEAYDRAVEVAVAAKMSPDILDTITISKACSQWLSGKKEDAKVTIERVKEPADPYVMYSLACFYSLADDIDVALSWLKKALQDAGFKESMGNWPETDDDLNNIRDTPGFRELFPCSTLDGAGTGRCTQKLTGAGC
jgi:tetratricopeptide (TPR) repeat protein